MSISSSLRDKSSIWWKGQIKLVKGLGKMKKGTSRGCCRSRLNFMGGLAIMSRFKLELAELDGVDENLGTKKKTYHDRGTTGSSQEHFGVWKNLWVPFWFSYSPCIGLLISFLTFPRHCFFFGF